MPAAPSEPNPFDPAGHPNGFTVSEQPVASAEGDGSVARSVSGQSASENLRELVEPEGEERYRSLFNSIDEGFCVIDMIFNAEGKPVDWVFVEVNPAFEQQSGLLGAAGKRVGALIPNHEQYWFDVYGRVAITGEAVRFENFSAGLKRWFSLYAFRVGGSGSRRVAVIFNRITAFKAREARAEFLAELSRKVSLTTDEDQIARIAVEATGRELNADRCYFVECFENENLVIAGPNWCRGETSTLAGRYNLSDFGGSEWWREFSSGNFAVEDAYLNPLTRDRATTYAATGIRSYAVQPFRQQGPCTVALAVTDNVPRKWTPDDLHLLDDVTARVWSLILQARATRTLLKSEERFRALVTAGSDAVYRMNADWTEMSRLDAQGFLVNVASPSRTWLQAFIPETEQAKVLAAIQAAIQAKGIFQLEHRVLRADGTIGWTFSRAVPILAANGEISEWFGAASDVTARKNAEEEIRESNARLEFTLESARIGDWDLDLLNDTARRSLRHDEAFGYHEPIPDWGYEKFLAHVHPEDRAEVAQKFTSAVANLQEWHFECRVVWPDGSVHWIEAHGNIYRLADGKPRNMLGIVVDITARKTAEELLRRAMDEVERISRTKDDFLAALSHELRTPLSPVLITAAALREDARLPEDVREQLGMMERNIALEARLIDDLLDLTAISRGKLALRTELCDAHSLIGLSIEIVRVEALAKEITIERIFGAQRSGLVVDPARFQQVMWNLLRNAVKFTPRSGHISIRTQEETDERGGVWLRMEVADSGIGIEAERLERIFQPFDQGAHAGSHRFGGLGLGLTIARAVVDLHGGRIYAQSEGPNRGSTFVVMFPSARTPGPGVSQSTAPFLTGRSQSAGRTTNRAAVAPLHLLLVDDHESTLQTLDRLLQREGHRVVTAMNVTDALTAAETHRFDLLISDLGLPDGSGNELMEKLRERYGLRGIALSGYGMEEDLVRSRAAGFFAHVVKPVHLSELRRLLASLPPKTI